MTLGWADHEEEMAQLKGSRAYFRDQAKEWQDEAVKVREELRQLREATAFARSVILHGKAYGSLDKDLQHNVKYVLDWLTTLLPGKE